MAKEIETKMVFGVTPSPGDGVPLLLLGIPAGAWEHMRDGKTHTFDLTKIGLPVKLMLYGASDHDAAMQVIHDHNQKLGVASLDLRRENFSLNPLPSDKRS